MTGDPSLTDQNYRWRRSETAEEYLCFWFVFILKIERGKLVTA